MSKINISLVSKREDDSFNTNHVNINMKGDKVNNVIVNTIRRFMLEEVPTYAFDLDKITIKSNTSVYNNDYMRNRIENFPIPNLENKFNINEYDLIRKNVINNSTDDEVLNNYDLLNIHVKEENNTGSIVNITTDNCDFYLKGNKINSIYKRPLLICKLKNKEKFEMSAVVKKSIALEHSKYSIVNLCSFEEINPNEFSLKYENRDQINNNEIFIRTCKIIIYRLEQFLNDVTNKKFSSEKYGKIILEKETHTLGNIISRSLQDNEDIEYASYRMDHLLISDLTIEYKIKGSKPINTILKESVTKQINIFKEIQEKFESLKMK